MKKLFVLSVVAGLLVTACGPSAAELEAKKKADSIALADSLAKVAEQAAADSIAAAAAADTTAAVVAQ